MNFKEYQEKSQQTAIYPNLGENFIYPSLGLAGETGEVMEKIKKLIRDQDGKINDEFKKEISKEMGDVLWYLAVLAEHLGVRFEQVAEANVAKLSSRKQRGAIGGSGDDR